MLEGRRKRSVILSHHGNRGSDRALEAPPFGAKPKVVAELGPESRMSKRSSPAL